MKIFYKRIMFTALAMLLLLLPSCQYDDAPLNDRVTVLENNYKELKAQVDAINANILSLQGLVNALNSKDTIEKVEKLDNGFKITFKDGGSYTIVNGTNGENGQDGNSPKIGVKQEGQQYYWTVDGDFLLDVEGQKIPATAHIATPTIKIDENNDFQISYDGGQTWEKMGPAGKPQVFSGVEDRETEVVFTLADGNQIIVPKTPKFRIVVEETEYGIGVTSLNVMFKVEGADEKTKVDAIGTNGFKASVRKYGADYRVKVSAGETPDGRVFIFAVNAQGATAACILSFEQGQFTVDQSKIKKLPADGGEITIPFMANIGATVSVDPACSGWMAVIQDPMTKALKPGTFKIAVAPTTEKATRSGIVYINPEGGLQRIELTIEQYGTEEVVPTGGGRMDVETFNGGQSSDYAPGGSAAGWTINEWGKVAVNDPNSPLPVESCPILSGKYHRVAAYCEYAVITSPKLTGGIGKMDIQFGSLTAKTVYLDFSVQIQDLDGNVLAEEFVSEPDVPYLEVRNISFDFNIPGDFKIVLTNTTYEFDYVDVFISKLEWTECL